MQLRSPHAHALALVCALALGLPAPAHGQGAERVGSSIRIGPAHGTLLVVGGGLLGPEILERFIQLAGGPDARIVVITTAAGADSARAAQAVQAQFGHSGARNLAVLNTPDPKVADTEAFAGQLRHARGVWFSGGRQWRLADAYLGTRTQRELYALLGRGGVIGGTSAGASIQASYLVRGAPEGNTIMMAPGHEQGLAFLRGVAVDQHILARHREGDLAQVVRAHPGLLGIGIDEGTAIEVHGDTAPVLGRSKVAITDGRDHDGKPFYFLSAGDRFDLASRSLLRSAGAPPADHGGERPTGTWRGASRCLVRPSACQDEDALYRVSAAAQADSVRLSAGKIVDGREVVMGVAVCAYAARRGSIDCALPNGSSVHLEARRATLAGTLALRDGVAWRAISLRRASRD